MTTHIMFPELDPKLPATLSPKVLRSLLRDELGFSGLIVTDCLEMKGVAAQWGTAEAAVLAAIAGADQILVSHTYETQNRGLKSISYFTFSLFTSHFFTLGHITSN